MNVRLEGIEYKENETNEELKVKIENVLKVAGEDVKPDILDRYHRSGKPYTTKGGTSIAQTIVRFRYWKPRSQIQRAKKSVRERKLPFQIRNDLTKPSLKNPSNSCHTVKECSLSLMLIAILLSGSVVIYTT